MRFVFSVKLPCAPGFTEQQRYHDILAQIDLGDEVGFDTVWLGELHFSRAFSILADPLMLLAAASQRTSRIRLGTAVTLLPLHNPVKIAEEAAIVDLLSNGRLEFGVGRGTAPFTTRDMRCRWRRAASGSTRRSIFSSAPGPASPSRSRANTFKLAS